MLVFWQHVECCLQTFPLKPLGNSTLRTRCLPLAVLNICRLPFWTFVNTCQVPSSFVVCASGVWRIVTYHFEFAEIGACVCRPVTCVLWVLRPSLCRYNDLLFASILARRSCLAPSSQLGMSLAGLQGEAFSNSWTGDLQKCWPYLCCDCSLGVCSIAHWRSFNCGLWVSG